MSESPAVAFSRGEHMDYHQVTDEAQYISYPDLARVSRMVYDAALAIANQPLRPRLPPPRPRSWPRRSSAYRFACSCLATQTTTHGT